MTLSVLLVIAGFAALIFGANWMVDGASALAKKYKVSDLVIGLTIVAFGTSAPELVVSVVASLEGYSDIVLGNVVGSNNFNLFIILGLVGLIFPIKVQSSTAWQEIPISLIVALLALLLLHDFYFADSSSLSRMDGLLLLVLFAVFIYYVFHQMKNEPQVDEVETQAQTPLKIGALIVLGLAGLMVGGQLVVDSSVSIAENLGISEKIIGLTIVATGTSLPELVTSVVAATKKNSDIAIGNVIGSNIFNILLILSVSSLIQPIAYSPKFDFDIFILLGGTLFLFLAMLTGKRKQLDCWEAAILLAFYVAYIVFLITV